MPRRSIIGPPRLFRGFGGFQFLVRGRQCRCRGSSIGNLGDFVVPLGGNRAHFVHKCAGSRRNQASDNHVFLETDQVVDLAGTPQPR